jgi:hypothetical protein
VLGARGPLGVSILHVVGGDCRSIICTGPSKKVRAASTRSARPFKPEDRRGRQALRVAGLHCTDLSAVHFEVLAFCDAEVESARESSMELALRS